jgi:hypothetical protein
MERFITFELANTGLITSFRFLTSLCLSFLTGTIIFASCAASLTARVRETGEAERAVPENSLARDREIAARFAPVFHQGLGNKPRSDYITNFDFDGDWRGDNNWINSQNTRFPLKAYVYYSVSETHTHFFVHYAVFHPQDYKGGQEHGPLLSEIIREGIKRGGRYDPTGLANEAVLAHENDLEGCLVVAAKATGNGDDLEQAEVVYVETLSHNSFLKYVARDTRQPASGPRFDSFETDGVHPLLYVEPKGHGVTALRESQRKLTRQKLLIYKYGGQADDPDGEHQGTISYELLPMASTIWQRARRGAKETFGATHKYGTISVNTIEKSGKASRHQFNLGTLGSAFLGKVGAPNMARPPWAWFDRSDAGRVMGSWFFDPAATIKRDFALGKDLSESYLHAPLLGIFR